MFSSIMEQSRLWWIHVSRRTAAWRRFIKNIIASCYLRKLSRISKGRLARCKSVEQGRVGYFKNRDKVLVFVGLISTLTCTTNSFCRVEAAIDVGSCSIYKNLRLYINGIHTIRIKSCVSVKRCLSLSTKYFGESLFKYFIYGYIPSGFVRAPALFVELW